MNDKNKNNNINNNNLNKVVTEQGNEFSEEISAAQVGLAPITGGLITRNLIKEGEEILMTDQPDKNKNNSPK